jgi:hypothetical protein
MELSKQVYLNPTTHNNTMTTYRVNPMPNTISNSLRLLNLQFNIVNQAGQVVGCQFKESGLWGCVKRLRLLSLENVELDNLEEVGQVMAVMNKILLSPDSVQTVSDEREIINNQSTIYVDRDYTLNLSVNQVDNSLQQLRLASALDFLRQSVCMNDGFTLQIEWNQNVGDWATSLDPANADPAQLRFNLNYPILAFEVYSRPLPSPQVVTYSTIRNNKVLVPANSNKVDLDLKGFKGNFIDRILVSTTLQTQPDYSSLERPRPAIVGKNYSLSLLNEVFNFSFDGKTVLSYKGINHDAYKAKLFSQIWGSLYAWQGSTSNVQYDSLAGTGLTGVLSYGAIKLATMINKEFLLNYTRDVTGDAVNSQALILNVFAEVRKAYDTKLKAMTYMAL